LFSTIVYTTFKKGCAKPLLKKAWQNQNSTFDVKLYYQPLDQIFNIVCLYGLAQPFSKVVS